MTIERTIIAVEWREDFNIDGWYWHPAYRWRFGDQRRPDAEPMAFPRTGDKRFGGWSC